MGAGLSKKHASKKRTSTNRSLPTWPTPPICQTNSQYLDCTLYETVEQCTSSGNEYSNWVRSADEATGDANTYLAPEQLFCGDRETTPKVSATAPQNDYTVSIQQLPASVDFKSEEQKQTRANATDQKWVLAPCQGSGDVYQSLLRPKKDRTEACETLPKTSVDVCRCSVPPPSAAPSSRPASTTTYNLHEVTYRPAVGKDLTTDVQTPPSTPAPPPPVQHHQRQQQQQQQQQEELDENELDKSPQPTDDAAYLTTNNDGVVMEADGIEQEQQPMSPCQIKRQCNLPINGYCGAQMSIVNHQDKKPPVQCAVHPNHLVDAQSTYNDIRQTVPTHYAAVFPSTPSTSAAAAAVHASHPPPAAGAPQMRISSSSSSAGQPSTSTPSAESRRATVLVMVKLVRGGASVVVNLQVLIGHNEEKLREQQSFRRSIGYVVVERTEGFVYLAAGDLHVELKNVSWMKDAVVQGSKKVDISLYNFWNGLAVLSSFMVESRRAVEKSFALDSNFHCEVSVQQDHRTPLVIAVLCDLHEITSRFSQRPCLANCPCSKGCKAETAKVGPSSVSGIHRQKDQSASGDRTRKARPKSIAVCESDAELCLRSDENTSSSSSSSSSKSSASGRAAQTAKIRSRSFSGGPRCQNWTAASASKAAATDDYGDETFGLTSSDCRAATGGSPSFSDESKRGLNVIPTPRNSQQRYSCAGIGKIDTVFAEEPNYWPATFV